MNRSRVQVDAGAEYTSEVIRNALRHFQDLAALPDSTQLFAPRKGVGVHAESLRCLYMDVREAVRRLPVRQREAVVLHLVMGLSEAETAHQLGISAFSARDRVENAVHNICRLLSACPGSSQKKSRNFPDTDPRQVA